MPAPLAEFGRWFRAFRSDRGVRSAAALSKLANLSLTYVSSLERGRVRPKVETVDRIADALKLSPADRAELHRQARLTGQPDSLREAFATVPLPGLSLWKHLPSLLFSKPHESSRSIYDSPDDVVSQVVQGCASLLAWAHIAEMGLKKADRRAVVDFVVSAASQPAETARLYGNYEGGNPGLIAAISLPQAVRYLLFDQSSGASDLVGLLESWSYCGTTSREWPSDLTIRFSDPHLQRSLGVTRIETKSVTGLHDTLIIARLWEDLELGGRFKLDRLPVLDPAVEGALVAVFRTDPEQLRGQLYSTKLVFDAKRQAKREALYFNSPLAFPLVRDCRLARYALRSLIVPSAAARILEHFGADERRPSQERLRPAVESRCDAIEAAILEIDALCHGRRRPLDQW